MPKDYQRSLLKEIHSLEIRYDVLKEENRELKYQYQLLEAKNKNLKYNFEHAKKIAIKQFNKENEKAIQNYEKQIEEKDKEIARLRSLLNNDGTNCSLPTSKTPINKNKVIPNSRKKSSKSIGGQKGHKKHKLERFPLDEITEVQYIELNSCPECESSLIDINETIEKDILDYKLVVEKKRIKFKKYKCSCCGKIVHAPIPNNLKEDNQYGPNVKSLILSLLNEGNVSINRVRRIINGFSGSEIDLSEGYISKVQKMAAKNLADFNNGLKQKILKQDLLYWDDTVIYVNKNRACLRFYGNEKLALYTAHEHKDKNGLDKDNILKSLDDSKVVMHDHNKVNYNNDYSFINLECNAHLQRELQKIIDNLNHNWAKELKELISKGINKRNEYLENGIKYNEEFTKDFFDNFNDIMLNAFEENKNGGHKYYIDTEKTLILRILDYKENYFAWVTDFELPTTNNLSERSLRSSKTKMKVSGQFQNIERASDYAIIKSYIETAYRNNINPYEALVELSLGNPLTIDEIIGEKK